MPDPGAATLAARLARLHGAAFVTPRPWHADEFAALLATPSVFLIERSHGFILGRVITDEAELLTLAVHPAHRRAGIGTALVTAFLDACRARHARRAFLEVAIDNAPARALYARTGFDTRGRRKNYYATPDGRRIDALIMACDLPPPGTRDARPHPAG